MLHTRYLWLLAFHVLVHVGFNFQLRVQGLPATTLKNLHPDQSLKPNVGKLNWI